MKRPIMDAGPGLNFFSLHRERLLFGALGSLSIPEAVAAEIRRRSGQDRRFAAADGVMRKIPGRLLEVLSDDLTADLARAVERIGRTPAAERLRTSKDLGETLVIAHAAVAAEAGADVIVLIDDGGGRRAAAAEARRLERLRAQGAGVGSIRLIGTLTVLERAAGSEHLPDRGDMRDLYNRLRDLDDGLPPLKDTQLMSLPCWRPS